MPIRVKQHKRVSKNKVSVVRNHVKKSKTSLRNNPQKFRDAVHDANIVAASDRREYHSRPKNPPKGSKKSRSHMMDYKNKGGKHLMSTAQTSQQRLDAKAKAKSKQRYARPRKNKK